MNYKKLIRIAIIALIVFVLFVLLPSIVTLSTDWLWFVSVGYQGIFTSIIGYQVILALVVGVVTFVLIYINLRIASRATKDASFSQSIQNTGFNVGKYFNKLLLVVSLLAGILFATTAPMIWDVLAKYLNYTSFNQIDPIFGKDIGYYFFTLPFVDAMLSRVFSIIVFSFIAVAVTYQIKGFISTSNFQLFKKSENQDNFFIKKTAKRHLSILGAVMLIMLAMMTYFVEIPKLVYSNTSTVFTGASYTDIYARLPFMWVGIVVALIAAVLLIVNIFRKKNKLVILAVGLYILVLIVGGIYQTAIQKLVVQPNELSKESEYIKNNIEFTQKAWGIDNVEKRDIVADDGLTQKDIQDNQLTIKNVRLWDREPLLDTFSQLQEIRTYYDFISVDNDRYTIDNEYRQVMLSPRELNTNSLPNKNFINERFTFTHGYGLTLGPVNQVTQEGLPVLFTQDLPPQSTVDSLKITRPEIYYGELSSDYVFVNTKTEEFDYPKGEENVFSNYESTGGVKIDSLFKKALFAIKFQSLKIFLSNDLDNESQVLFHRNITERVEKVLPFLKFDSDPYMVIDDAGRQKWIYDAYTVSNLYPYSETMGSDMNYMRNSVKIVIDAYDGSMKFYISDPSDPMIQTYAKIFGGVFLPLTDIPQDLKSHLRYPEDIFNYQTKLYRTYHMEQPQIFYNKEDQWEIPYVSEAGDSIDPIMRHLIMKLPGEVQEEFILMIPYTPRQKDNMAAWMVARSDGENYGKLVVYQFGKQKLVYGPKQINNRINQDASISQQVSLWDQRGSQVIQGNLLVIPIEESLLYVRPLYIKAEGGKIPELKRVIVAYDNKIAMEETLDEALGRIFGGEVTEATTRSAGSGQDVTEVTNDKVETVKTNDDLIKEAKKYFDEAQKAQQNGDWAKYGEQIRLLEETLGKL